MEFQPKNDLNENKPMQSSTTQSTTLQSSTMPSSTMPSSTMPSSTMPSSTIQSSTMSSSKPSSLGDESQDYWYYCSHSFLSDDQNKSTYEKEKKHDKKMDSLICNSHEMLKEYCDPKLYVNQKFPHDLFHNCKGIIFLRIWKAGIFVGGIGGTGVVLAHYNGFWSHPCAISISGIQLGFHVGVERVDDILILRDEAALNLFIQKGHFKLGMDASIAIGNFGRDSNTGITMSHEHSKSIYSYSFAKGAFIGLSLDGGVLSIDDNVNEEYYGRKIDVKDIFYGNAVGAHNDHFWKLQQLLSDCCLNKGGNLPHSHQHQQQSSNIENVNTSINK